MPSLLRNSLDAPAGAGQEVVEQVALPVVRHLVRLRVAYYVTLMGWGRGWLNR